MLTEFLHLNRLKIKFNVIIALEIALLCKVVNTQQKSVLDNVNNF